MGRENHFTISKRVKLQSIAFGFDDGHKLGLISVYTSTQECSISDKVYDKSKLSSVTLTVKKMIKEIKHKFPGIYVMVLGDMQETITTSEYDNVGKYRKDYLENGLVAHLLKTH